MSRLPALAECPVMILAGGLGTRLKSVVSDRPKGLAPVGDQPFLEIQICLLRDQGARRFVLCVGHGAAQICDCLGDGSRLGVQLEYSLRPRRSWAPGEPCALPSDSSSPMPWCSMATLIWRRIILEILKHHIAERAQRGVVATVTLARQEDTSALAASCLIRRSDT